MAKGNSTQNPRNIFKTSNKYQEKMILLSFFPSALIFLSFVCIVFISNPAVSKVLFHNSFLGVKDSPIKISGTIVFIMCFFFILSLILSFIISLNMIGAFGRIINELDEIIARRSQKAITDRPNDTLSKELLKRVNVLVKFYVEHGKKGQG